MHRIFQILAAIVCLILASCIDGREEYWLNTDGSGRAKVRYEVPKASTLLHGGTSGIRKKVDAFMTGNASAFSKSAHSVTEADGRVSIELDVSFASAQSLENLAVTDRSIPGPVSHLIGEFRFTRNSREVGLVRTISPGKALPGSRFMPASRFKDRSLTYIVHLPVPANRSNATRTENNASTLIWEYPLASTLRQPITTEFEVTVPIPRHWIVGASIAGLALTALAFSLLRSLFTRRRARRGSIAT